MQRWFSSSALGMTENTSSKNNTQRNDSKQNVVKRRSKQSPHRGVSWGTSIACGLLTTATTMATSSLSARFGEYCLEAAVTDLTFGFGGNLVSTTIASNVPANPEPKNTYKGGISRQKQELQQRRYGSWSKWGKGMRPEYV